MKSYLIWVIVLGSLGYGGAKLYLHHKVGKNVDTAVIMMSPFVQVEYSGISSTMSGKLTIDGIRAKVNGFDDSIYIERLGIDTPHFLALLELGDIATGLQSSGGDLPGYFGLIAEGVRWPVNADYYRKLYNLSIDALGVDDADQSAAECVGKYGFSPNALTELGYREQVMSISTTVRQQESGFVFEMVTDIENMWDLNVDLTLAGDLVSEVSKGAAFRPRLSNLTIEYTDQSLNERVQRYCERRGLSSDEIRKAQLDAFNWFGERNGVVFDEYVLEPYKEFIAGKKTLVLTAEPNEPINMSQIDLYKPADVPALLNLSAAAH